MESHLSNQRPNSVYLKKFFFIFFNVSKLFIFFFFKIVDLMFAPAPSNDPDEDQQMLPSKFWNEVAKRKERLRRSQSNKTTALSTPSNNKRTTIINLHSPMRQKRLKDTKEKKAKAKRKSGLNILSSEGGGNSNNNKNNNNNNSSSSSRNNGRKGKIKKGDVSVQSLLQGVQTDVQVTGPRSPKKDAFSIIDEEDDLFDSPTSSIKKNEIENDDDEMDWNNEINFTNDALIDPFNDPLSLEADKGIDELALLEAELGLEGDMAVSSTLRNLGKNINVTPKTTTPKEKEELPVAVQVEDIHVQQQQQRETKDTTTTTATNKTESETIPPVPSTVAATASVLPDDLDDFDFDDLSAELDGMNVGDEGDDDEGDTLEDLDDFLAGLED